MARVLALVLTSLLMIAIVGSSLSQLTPLDEHKLLQKKLQGNARLHQLYISDIPHNLHPASLFASLNQVLQPSAKFADPLRTADPKLQMSMDQNRLSLASSTDAEIQDAQKGMIKNQNQHFTKLMSLMNPISFATKPGTLINDCLRKAKLVFYRTQISQDQPEFVRACYDMWQTLIEKAKSKPEMIRKSLTDPQLKWYKTESPKLKLKDTRIQKKLQKDTTKAPQEMFQHSFPMMKPLKSVVQNSQKWMNIGHGFIPLRHLFTFHYNFYRPRIVDEKRQSTLQNIVANEPQVNGFSNMELLDGINEGNMENTDKARVSDIMPVEDLATSQTVDTTPENHSRSKRAPWAGSEPRYNILDMLRSRLHARGKKDHSNKWPRDSDRSKRGVTYLDLPESRDSWPKIRRTYVEETQRKPQPSKLHPFSGGMGDYAAEMVLQIYAQLLRAELQNNNNLDGINKTTRNVRPFIG